MPSPPHHDAHRVFTVTLMWLPLWGGLTCQPHRSSEAPIIEVPTSALSFEDPTSDPPEVSARQQIPCLEKWHGDWCYVFRSEHSLQALWGTGPQDFIAVGSKTTPRKGGEVQSDGYLVNRSSGKWLESHIKGAVLNGVWGHSSNDVLALGCEGEIYRFDGTSWQLEFKTDPVCLYGAWGASRDDLWVVGGEPNQTGLIAHYDGKNWTSRRVPSTGSIHEIAGAAKDAIYAADTDGHLLVYDGSQWHVKTPTQGDLYAHDLLVLGRNEVIACGWSSNFFRFRRRLWGPAEPGRCTAIWGSGPSNIYAVDWAQNRHFDGDKWDLLAEPVPRETYTEFHDVWGFDERHVYALAWGDILRLQPKR